jgi:hypothetical protein
MQRDVPWHGAGFRSQAAKAVGDTKPSRSGPLLLVRPALLCGLAVAAAGCAGDTGPPLAPVSGTLLVDGRPIAGVSVMFVPDNRKGTSGPASVGVTGADGAFTLTAPGNRPGAIVGHHKVTAACPFDPAGGSSASGVAADASGTRCSIPTTYGDPVLTPLEVEVKAERGANAAVALEVVGTP